VTFPFLGPVRGSGSLFVTNPPRTPMKTREPGNGAETEAGDHHDTVGGTLGGVKTKTKKKELPGATKRKTAWKHESVIGLTS